MNDSNSVENQLRQWTLRQPSERIREELFGSRPAAPELAGGLRFGEMMRWLVPVMGCFLLVIGSLSPRHSQGVQEARALLQFPDSMQSPSLLSDPNTEQNAVPRATLEWTFGSRSPSSMASFIDFKTNTLKH